jgi:hypothetical protein
MAMPDSLSRFAPVDFLDDKPDIKRKVLRALASKAGLPVNLTAEEADLLITEGGGPDPDYPTAPRQMYIYQGRALVVQGGSSPRCWRL